MTMTWHQAELTGGCPVVPSAGALRPLGVGEVRITGGFWAPRQRVNSENTLRHGLSWMDRLGWTGNFRPDADRTRRRGREFADSEVYKLLEAMLWEAGRAGGRADDEAIAELVATIATAQSPDGYLNTAFGGRGQQPRFSDLVWGHELYCTGHLLQAAVAHLRTRGDGPLVRIARRAADHVCDTFGPDGVPGICGHPQIEPALVEFARVTGEQRYLEQAALFLGRRGHRSLPAHEFGWAYFSDDTPIRQATVFRGHAVRALYLACGAVDVAVETGDHELLEVVAAQFRRTLARRTYLTGGMGSRHLDEAFGDDFVLPADRAYAETCAGVAAVMLAWRLLLATGDGHYGDIIERILYNVVATAISDDGQAFFYANTLHQRTPTAVLPRDREQLAVGGGPRASWYEVSCCLPNIARLIASLASYVASVADDELHLHQYADTDIATRLADGRRVGVAVRTCYPENGTVTVQVTESAGGPWALILRVPEWAHGAMIVVDGQRRPVAPGDVEVRQHFARGTQVRLELPMAPRFTWPDPRIDAIRGCVAVERGPLVLCVETTGEDAGDLDSLRVDPEAAPVDTPDGVAVQAQYATPTDGAWPYEDAPPDTPARATAALHLLPYHRWARRGPATMRVWLPAATAALPDRPPAPRRRRDQ